MNHPHDVELRSRGRRATMLVAPALLLALCLGAVTSANESRRKPGRLAAALGRAPITAQAWPNPYEGRSDAVRAGAKLFRQHCAECHGESAQGLGKVPALRSTVIQQTPPGVLFWFLRNGNLRRGMPSWSGLPDEQRWQIVSYLRTLR